MGQWRASSSSSLPLDLGGRPQQSNKELALCCVGMSLPPLPEGHSRSTWPAASEHLSQAAGHVTMQSHPRSPQALLSGAFSGQKAAPCRNFERLHAEFLNTYRALKCMDTNSTKNMLRIIIDYGKHVAYMLHTCCVITAKHVARDLFPGARTMQNTCFPGKVYMLVSGGIFASTRCASVTEAPALGLSNAVVV